MSSTLSRWQAISLGLVVVLCLGVGAWGMLRIGGKSGLFSEHYEIAVYIPDAQDIDRGTAVRIRGVEAGKVIAVEYPTDDGGDGTILLRLQLDKKFEERLFADSSASIVSKGLFGSSFIAIQSGKPSAGPLASRNIRFEKQADLSDVTAKLSSVAARIDNVVREIEQGNGTTGKLIRDDSLYTEFRGLVVDARKLINNTNDTVGTLKTDAQKTMANAQKALDGINTTLSAVEGEISGLKQIVRLTKDAIGAIRADAEAIKSMPIVRNYVTDEIKLLIRPDCTKDPLVYDSALLFEDGRAVLTADGRRRIGETAAWLRGQRQKNSEVVVFSLADPKDKNETAVSARELTRKRSEVVAALLKEYGAAKLGTFTSRNIVPIGFGFEPTPIVEKEELPAARTEIILFVPQ